jgi:hypothetical protein
MLREVPDAVVPAETATSTAEPRLIASPYYVSM